MASIQTIKRTDSQGKPYTRYAVMWREKGKQRKKVFDKRHLADYCLAELQKNEGLSKAGNPRTEMEQFWRDYLQTRFAGKPKNTIQTDTWAYNQLKQFFKDNYITYLDDIAPTHIQQLINKKVEEGCKPNGINRQLSYLKSSFKFAADTYHEKYRKLYDAVKPLRVREEYIPQILSTEELQRFFKTCPEQHIPYFSLLAYTGIRKSELERLRWEDIFFDKNLIVIQGATKSGRLRTVAMHEELRSILEPLKQENSLVVGPNQNARRVYQRILKKAGISKNVTIHGLRHSFATALLEVSGDLRLVQSQLGHSRVTVTERYTHILGNRALEAVNKIKLKPGRSD